MNELMRKLTSRKLWVAIAGIATGVCVALGGEASEVQTVAGAIAAVVSAVTYILAESRVDAERVKTAVESVQQAVDVVGGVSRE